MPEASPATLAPAAGSSVFKYLEHYCAPLPVSFYSGRRAVFASYPTQLPSR